MSEWLFRDDYAEVWQCYADLPVHQMKAAEVIAMVTPGSGKDWTDELCWLWTNDTEDTLLLLRHIAEDGVTEPIVVGNDGRLWDGHHRVAAALALDAPLPVRVIPKGRA